MKPNLHLQLMQPSMIWADPQANLELAEQMLREVERPVDMIIFPEAFTTGFVMKAKFFNNYHHTPALVFFENKARDMQAHILTGIFASENGKLYNRLYWFRPDGSYEFYNKRHLFSAAGEDQLFTPGRDPVTVDWEGIRFRLNICYDLRFPVWSANRFDSATGRFDYDVLIYVANWPEKRKNAYLPLLRARAIENQAYVIWVNRVGRDKNRWLYSGDSRVIDPMGNVEYTLKSHQQRTGKHVIDLNKLDKIREQMPFYRDWDTFRLENHEEESVTDE